MRTRTYKKQFWLNEEEVRALRNKSLSAGLSETQFIRNILLDYKVKEKPDDRFYDVMKYMRYISNNLNQIAVKAHTLNYIDEPFYKRECEKWNKFMEDVKSKYLIS